MEKKLGVFLEDGEATDCFNLAKMEEWEEILARRPDNCCIKTYVPATEDDETPPEQVVWVTWDYEGWTWAEASYGGGEPSFVTWKIGQDCISKEPILKFVPEQG